MNVDDVKVFKKTSFDEVTQHLHKNGDFYMYFSAEQTIDNTSKGCSTFIDMVTKDLEPADKANVDKLLNVFKAVGLGELDSVGVSSVPVNEHFFNRRVVTVHGKDKGEGLIWNLLAKENKDFSDTLKMLPEETVFAHYNSLSVKRVFDWLNKMVKNSNDQEIQQQFQGAMQMASVMLGNELGAVLDSLENETVIVGTLNEAKMIHLPGVPVEVPEFGLAVIVKTKDRTLFDLCSKYIPRTEADLKKEGTVDYLEFKGNEKLSIIKPVIVQSDDKLILSLNKTLSDKLLASDKKSLLESATFTQISKTLPREGVGFDYVSPKLNETVKKFIKDSFEGERQKSPVFFMDQLLDIQQFLIENTSNFPTLYSVTEVIERGYLNSSYTSQTTGDMVIEATLTPVAMVVAVAAAIVPFTTSAIEAIPPSAMEGIPPDLERKEYVKEVELAVAEFLAEHPGKTISDVTWEDLAGYLDAFDEEFEDDMPIIHLESDIDQESSDEFGDVYAEGEVEIISEDAEQSADELEPLTLEDFEVNGVVPTFENGRLIYR